jgi:hypothetical protein
MKFYPFEKASIIKKHMTEYFSKGVIHDLKLFTLNSNQAYINDFRTTLYEIKFHVYMIYLMS